MSCKQLIQVITPSWTSMQGTLCLFEQTQNEPWKHILDSIPVVVGEGGMAWGLGLHPNTDGPFKKEGDQKTPAGLFSLGKAFGHKKQSFKIDFLLLNPHTEAIDDPSSRFYNQIVNGEIPDWKSSEKMSEIDLYELGIVIQHNPRAIPHAGSAIFIHVWRESNQGTAGCTAMSLLNLKRLLNCLDKAKEPKIVQMPNEMYNLRRAEWNLP